MTCRYKLGEYTFNSELELDSFLLGRKDLIKQYGDEIYSKKQADKKVLNKGTLTSEIGPNAKAKDLKTKWKEAKRSYIDGEEIEQIDPPYVGVTSYLSQVTVNGNLLFPEFTPDYTKDGKKGYWPRRIEHWTGQVNPEETNQPKWTQDEIDLFFNGDATLAENTTLNPTDTDTIQLYRQLMTKKWEEQAKYGTQIHSVLSYCFRPSYSPAYKGFPIIFEFLNQSNQKLMVGLKRAIDNGYVDAKGLDDKILDQTITYAKSLFTEIRQSVCPGQDISDIDFYSEIAVAAPLTGPVDAKQKHILGVIDLLVIDRDGNIHIFDFKTSPKTYEQYDEVKKNTFTYQLNTYRHILNTSGLDTFHSTINILPIKLEKFGLKNPQNAFDITKEGNTYKGVKQAEFSFEGITYEEEMIKNLDKRLVEKSYIEDNIETFLPTYKNKQVLLTDLYKNVAANQAKWFSGNEALDWDDDSIIELIKTKKGDVPDESDGKYHFRTGALFMKDIVADSETELVSLVKKEIKSQNAKKERVITVTVDAIDKSLEEGHLVSDFITPKRTAEENSTLDWAQNIFEKYIDGNWTRMKGGAWNAVLENYGLICMRNTVTGQYNFIKISTSNLGNTKIFGEGLKRQYLTGSFQTDIQVESDTNNHALPAEQGFVELMEVMNVINNMGPAIQEGFIGELSVINPFHGIARQATNEQLLYNYKAFVSHYGLQEDEADLITVADAPIKLLAGYELAYQMLQTSLNGVRAKGQTLGKDFRTLVLSLDQHIHGGNKEQTIATLQTIARKLENDYGWLKVVPNNPTSENNKIRAIYDQVMIGIANLQGINFDVQTKDHSKWLEYKGKDIFTKGVTGTYMDNPGNLKSNTLNLITKQVTEAYQQIRQDMVEPKAKLHELLNALKKDKGYSKAKQMLGGDWRQLYGNMFRNDTEEFLFKNPYRDDMSDAERNFLSYIIPAMALARPNNQYTLDEIIERMKADDLDFFKVPLAKSSVTKETVEHGILGGIKEKLKVLDPRRWKKLSQWGITAYENLMAATTGDFIGDTGTRRSADSKLFEMSNIFDQGYNPQTRSQALKKHGQFYFEHDLETLFLKHQYAAFSKKRIDNIFPTIKAAMIYLSRSAWEQNTSFENDMQYMEDYIRASIKNENVWADTPQLKQVAGITSKMTRVASFMTLAFSPVQFTYQSFQGLLQTISLVLRKPDGSKYTFEMFMKAFRAVYSDLWHYSDKPTKCSLINELYAINDMDMNVYAERLKQDQTGFTNFAFKFASRPDYYNRMWIIAMKMMEEGSWDAFTEKNGKLEYDWTLDKRYSVFAAANGDINRATDKEEFKKQKALYIANYRQFQSEGTITEPIDLDNPKPLPLPYTNQEMESTKSICDLIYGYYAHEKKSLVHNLWLGAIFMQMRTYWSGKKNQYLAPGGVKLLGSWEQLSNDKGEPQYYQVIDGVVRTDLPPTSEDTGVPFIQWKGKFQEGILMTIVHELSDAKDNITNDGLIKGLYKTYKELDKTNSWEDYYRINNLKQLGYDILAYLIFGLIIANILKSKQKQLALESKKDQDFGEALAASLVYIGYRTVSNAASDFNAFDGILSPVTVSVSPFSFNWWTNTSKNIWNTVFGDKHFIQGMANTMSVTRQFKPVFDVLDAQTHE